MNYILICFLFVQCAMSVEYIVINSMVVRIRPKGFRISIPDHGEINQVEYHVNINKPILPLEMGDFAAVITESTNGRWIFDNIITFVEPGSSIHFWFVISSNSSTVGIRFLKTAIVSEDSIELLQYCPSSIDVHSAFTKPSMNCYPSPTTVGQKSACKGQLIFHDNFRILNLTRWTREVRMPFDEENAPFVSFQSQWENCYVKNDKLHIVPTLQSEVPGYDESKIRFGSLNLEDCTGAKDKPWECSRQARYSQILPPVISAKIQTKHSFSFRYGKVEIRARLPKGDWFYPMILLEPLENYYGVSDYVSGQIRIVYNQGNKLIRYFDGKSTSNNMIYGGVLISDTLRDSTLKGPRFISSEFHTYTLNWTEDQLSFGVDGIDYGHVRGNFSKVYSNIKHAKDWDKGNQMAPFDREFFLSLSVSVGGHSEFSDDCEEKSWRNFDPKAMSDFWKDRKNWKETWEAKTSQLQIDYIKVYAV